MKLSTLKLNLLGLLTALCLGTQLQADVINFSGELGAINADDGSGVFGSSPLGTPVSGFIDDQTFNGEITVGGVTAAFGCCIAAGGLGLSNDVTLDADTVEVLNELAGGPVFTPNQVVDGIDIEGDIMVSMTNRLEVGVSYLLVPEAFDNEDPANYPVDPGDVLLALFFILEEDGANDVYDILGAFDTDADGVADAIDNCQLLSNPSQLDANGDGFGNRCDPDLDNNGITNFADVSIFALAFLSMPVDPDWNPDADFDGSGVVNFIDFGIAYPAFFLQPPGPSALAP